MKKVVFVISSLGSGGAENVISLLSDGLVERGLTTELLLTNQTKADAEKCIKKPKTQIVSLMEMVENRDDRTNKNRILFVLAHIFALFGESGKEISEILKYKARNEHRICAYKRYLKSIGSSVVVAFLNEPIVLSLLSKQKTTKLIISERADPIQYERSRRNMAFVNRLYPKCDYMVFQTPDAKAWYDKRIFVNGSIIYNPIRNTIPNKQTITRKRKIVNFCRISYQKNLILLLDAFVKFYSIHPEYELCIFGDTSEEEKDYFEKIQKYAEQSIAKTAIRFQPARKDILEEIYDYAMFVSSSDLEGMSNSMLEAMAIGLPTICTDCPAGGARAVIKDHENGILVPVGDSEKLYLAMKEVAENPELAEKLSRNAVKIREEQSEEKILSQWEKLIND